MRKNIKYKVAEHIFEIEFPENFQYGKYLTPYQPFIYEGEHSCLFKLTISLTESLSDINPGRICQCFNEEPPYLWLFECGGDYNFGFSYTKKHPDCFLIPGDGYKDSILYLPSLHAPEMMDFAINNALMLLYTYNTTPLETLMIHSSVVVKGGKAYSFLGKSGTGKSTHSRLWLENIPEVHLLNDDNPVIRLTDGQVLIYGTPWSGKTPCYKNEVYPLGGIVRLTQAPYNRMRRLGGLESYAGVLPSCSCLKWYREQTDALSGTVEAVVRQVRCWGLECLPDADAAIVCCKSVSSI